MRIAQVFFYLDINYKELGFYVTVCLYVGKGGCKNFRDFVLVVHLRTEALRAINFN
jgi:hypothetical protein